jgi:preprotein translocase subunit SecB
MKLAPLQLEAYFLTDLSFRANQEFDKTKPVAFQEPDLAVLTGIQPDKNLDRRWQVTLNIKLQSRPEANSPYFFALNLVGIVWAAAELPPDRLPLLLATNGPAMLYGVAREVVRDLTSRGPFPPLSLPSISFLPDPPNPQPQTPAVALAEQTGPQVTPTKPQ